MSLTSKQRAALRGMANTMEPVFQIGKGAIDETLIKGVDDCIKARELIKLKAVYEHLESISDRCEDVANIVEGIVLENS